MATKRLTFNDFFGILKQAAFDWSEDRAPRLGAALAYYTVFSLAPLILITISVAGLFLGTDAVRGEVSREIQGVVGPHAAEAIESMVAGAEKPATSIGASLVGIVVLLFGASGVFGQLQDALNTIWEVEPKPGRGIWGIIKDRFFSFTMVLGTGFLFLVSLVLSAALSAVTSATESFIPGPDVVAHVLNFCVAFGIVTALLALLFKYLPDVKVAWADVWVGALITALLFVLGKYAIGLYLGQASVGSSYGAAGSVVVVLIWLYYSAQIFLYGAEFTQAYARWAGRVPVPSEDAVPAAEGAHKGANAGVPVDNTSRSRPETPPMPHARPAPPQEQPLSTPAMLAVLAAGYLLRKLEGKAKRSPAMRWLPH